MKIDQYKDEYIRGNPTKRAELLVRAYDLVHQGGEKPVYQLHGHWFVKDWAVKHMLRVEGLIVDYQTVGCGDNWCQIRSRLLNTETRNPIPGWEWVYSGANGLNCRINYCPEMAEKRGRGRSCLNSLLSSVHGYAKDFYSEGEDWTKDELKKPTEKVSESSTDSLVGKAPDLKADNKKYNLPPVNSTWSKLVEFIETAGSLDVLRALSDKFDGAMAAKDSSPDERKARDDGEPKGWGVMITMDSGDERRKSHVQAFRLLLNRRYKVLYGE